MRICRPQISLFSDLPQTPVDLVIAAFDQENTRNISQQQQWCKGVTRWCNQNMAPILCLCPSEAQVLPYTEPNWANRYLVSLKFL